MPAFIKLKTATKKMLISKEIRADQCSSRFCGNSGILCILETQTISGAHEIYTTPLCTSLTHHSAAGANLPQPRSAEIPGSGGRAADRQSRACLSRRRVCAAALGLSTADGRPKGLRQLSARRAGVGQAAAPYFPIICVSFSASKHSVFAASPGTQSPGMPCPERALLDNFSIACHSSAI